LRQISCVLNKCRDQWESVEAHNGINFGDTVSTVINCFTNDIETN
jgi:phosphatidylserine decarboxylase